VRSRDLPSGTVTFLFTDIERSTRLLHELGEAYIPAFTEHRRILRETFGRHNGVEVSTGGDAFFVVFRSAADAVAAATEAQAALEPGRIWVRMGLHTGESFIIDGDYVGLEVHKAARIAASGHGGQVLLSEETGALLGKDMSLMDLGEHELKDFDEPIRIFQLGDERFPPLRTLAVQPYPGRRSVSFEGSARFPNR
jgi:class 3 adenylate cyclase